MPAATRGCNTRGHTADPVPNSTRTDTTRDMPLVLTPERSPASFTRRSPRLVGSVVAIAIVVIDGREGDGVPIGEAGKVGGVGGVAVSDWSLSTWTLSRAYIEIPTRVRPGRYGGKGLANVYSPAGSTPRRFTRPVSCGAD